MVLIWGISDKTRRHLVLFNGIIITRQTKTHALLGTIAKSTANADEESTGKPAL
jgi:hypothetical protein